MSFKYFLHTWNIRMLGMKKMTQMSLSQLRAFAQAAEDKTNIHLPHDTNDFQYRAYTYDPRAKILKQADTSSSSNVALGKTCIVAHPKAQDTQSKDPDNAAHKRKAILYVYGTGMLMPPQAQYLQNAIDLGARTQCDIWYPLYPACTHSYVEDALQMLRATYAKMLEIYDANDITFYGFSSGAALAIALSLNISHTREQLPQPSKIISISCAAAPASEDEYREMLAFERYDIAIDPKYFSHMRKILTNKHGKTPEYMLSLTGARFDCCPPIHLYAGGRESLSVKSQALHAYIQENGGTSFLTIAPNMCHCYCTQDTFAEAKKDYDEICEIIRS